MKHLIDQIKTHPEYDHVGMILCHNGVVRKTTRDGREVSRLRVSVDHAQLDRIIAEHKKMPGIIEILIEIIEDQDLSVGDDIMYLVVAGDIREHVIDALHQTLNAIKSQATHKIQAFA